MDYENTDDFDYFDINPDDLRSEWLAQTKIYRKHAYRLADARADYERAKAAREVVEAELDKSIRLHPEQYNVEKITEGVVERTIKLQAPYKKAVEDVIKAKHSVDIHQADVETLDQKKKALENAVQLLQSGFWAEPRVKGDATDGDAGKQALRRHGQKKRGGV